MNEAATLLTEISEEGVLTLRLNRPSKMNAIATPLLKLISTAMSEADNDSSIRAIIITGSDKVFAAGADINELKTRRSHDGLSDERPALWGSIRTTRKPVLAAIEGYCLGAGNELLMCCDIAIAGEGSKFGQPESNLGIIPGAGGATLLPRLIGQQKAMRMVLLGEFLSASEALECGLVSEITEKGQALDRTVELAIKIARRAPLAMMQGKAVIRGALETTLSAGLTQERQAFSLLLSTQDKAKGVQAFLDKEKAQWSAK